MWEAWRIGGSIMETPKLPAIPALRPAWSKGRIVGQKRPLKPKDVWAIRVRLELSENHRDLALFNMAIDSKLRGCDLVKMKVVDVMAFGQIKERATALQSKTQKPVRFQISEGTRTTLERWMQDRLMVGSDYLWPGRFRERLHISTRKYAHIVRDWVTSVGLEASAYGTHSMRRTVRWQTDPRCAVQHQSRVPGETGCQLGTDSNPTVCFTSWRAAERHDAAIQFCL
jgi:integrase